MPSGRSRDWDEKDKARGYRDKEPSQRFYDVVISGTLGMFVGIVVTVWVFLV